MTILGIVVGLLLLSIMMLVHELGHFLAGKALGFKIISFNIFMGPILWQRRGKDGVLYALRLIPIGASVEFAGEDSGINEDPENPEVNEQLDPDDPSLFYNRPRWARAIVIAMGPLINFLTAILAFIILFSAFGTAIPEVDQVDPNSPAAEVGLESGDRLLKMNGYRIYSVLDYGMASQFMQSDENEIMVRKADGSKREYVLTMPTVERYKVGVLYNMRDDGRILIDEVDAESNQGNPVLQAGDELLEINGNKISDPKAFDVQDGTTKDTLDLLVLREGQELSLQMIAETYETQLASGIINMKSATRLTEKMQQAFVYPISIIQSTFKGLSMIFSGQIKARDGLAGPVAIVGMVGGVVQGKEDVLVKVEQLLLLFGFISVAIGFTNLLPIPPLDGFHLLTLAIEGIRRKDLPMKLKERIAMVGFIIIILLFVLVFYLDISRLIFGK